MKFSPHHNNLKRSHCQNFRQLFAKTLLACLLAMLGAIGLVACKADAPKASKGNSGGGNTTSRPGDAPTAGDPGGADAFFSTEEEVQAEVFRALKQFKTNGQGMYPSDTIFHTLSSSLHFYSDAQRGEVATADWGSMDLSRMAIRRVVQKDSLLLKYSTSLTHEREILDRIFEKLGATNGSLGSPMNSLSHLSTLKKIESHLSQSPISFEMSDCAADLDHKLAAVSKHQLGATICFNLKALTRIPRESLSRELYGLIFHEYLHLLGFRESEVVLMHNLLRMTWFFKDDWFEFRIYQEVLDDLSALASAWIDFYVDSLKANADKSLSTQRLTTVAAEINGKMRLLLHDSKNRVVSRVRLEENLRRSSRLVQSQLFADHYKIDFPFSPKRNEKEDGLIYQQSAENIASAQICGILNFSSRLTQLVFFESVDWTQPQDKKILIFLSPSSTSRWTGEDTAVRKLIDKSLYSFIRLPQPINVSCVFSSSGSSVILDGKRYER